VCERRVSSPPLWLRPSVLQAHGQKVSLEGYGLFLLPANRLVVEEEDDQTIPIEPSSPVLPLCLSPEVAPSPSLPCFSARC